MRVRVTPGVTGGSGLIDWRERSLSDAQRSGWWFTVGGRSHASGDDV